MSKDWRTLGSTQEKLEGDSIPGYTKSRCGGRARGKASWGGKAELEVTEGMNTRSH